MARSSGRSSRTVASCCGSTSPTREEDWTYAFLPAFEEVDWTFTRNGSEEQERDRHIRANAASLERLVLNSVAFIEEMCSRGEERPLVSGGGRAS
jgi:hypothetical protein